MKIAICDDELTAREKIVTLVEDYSIEKNINIDYETFETYEGLKDKIPEFDLFILDYQMPGIDGMEFAQTIRENYGDDKIIIFVTSFNEIVYESFKVRTFRFIVKPIDKKDLFELLDSYISMCGDKKKLIIKKDGEVNVLTADDIFYIRAERKDSFVIMSDEEIFCHKPISWFEDELADNNFFRAHRTFLVNMKKIKKFDNRYIEMLNGYKVSLSSRKYKELCKLFLDMK